MYKFKIFTKGKNHSCVFRGNDLAEYASTDYTQKEFSEILDTEKVIIECDDTLAVKPIMKAIVMSLGRTGDLPEFQIANPEIDQMITEKLEVYIWKEK